MFDTLRWNETVNFAKTILAGKPTHRGFALYDKRGNVIDRLPQKEFVGLDQLINTGYAQIADKNENAAT